MTKSQLAEDIVSAIELTVGPFEEPALVKGIVEAELDSVFGTVAALENELQQITEEHDWDNGSMWSPSDGE